VAISAFDAQGCLTAEGIARAAGAPPGRVPPELAAHLASCARCQRRLLAFGAPHAPAARRAPPPPWRMAVVVAGCILLVVIALILLRTLSPSP